MTTTHADRTGRVAPHVLPGQRVITASGIVAIVAFVRPDGVAYAWVAGAPVPRPVIVRGDAFGGEHDQDIGLAA